MNYYEFNCKRCGGFVGEPKKAYGYAGQWCHCAEPLRPEGRVELVNTTLGTLPTQHYREVVEHHKRCLEMLEVIEKAGYGETYDTYLKQIKAQGAVKLAEVLLGSEIMEEKTFNECGQCNNCETLVSYCEQAFSVSSHNTAISAIKAKIKELTA